MLLSLGGAPMILAIMQARMSSTRLPGKPLASIAGSPMIVCVWRQAVAADIGPVVVAAAEPEIVASVEGAGGRAILTDPDLPSGSDRVFAALKAVDPAGRHDVVVNLQGDLPALDPAQIRIVAEALGDADIATLAAEIDDPADRTNPSVVKPVVASLKAAVRPVVETVVKPVVKAVRPIAAPVRPIVDPVLDPVRSVVDPVTHSGTAQNAPAHSAPVAHRTPAEGDAHSARHRIDAMQAGRGIDDHMPGRQLGRMHAISILDQQFTAVVFAGIGKEQCSRYIGTQLLAGGRNQAYRVVNVVAEMTAALIAVE